MELKFRRGGTVNMWRAGERDYYKHYDAMEDDEEDREEDDDGVLHPDHGYHRFHPFHRDDGFGSLRRMKIKSPRIRSPRIKPAGSSFRRPSPMRFGFSASRDTESRWSYEYGFSGSWRWTWVRPTWTGQALWGGYRSARSMKAPVQL
jgi:hypothetical protein